MWTTLSHYLITEDPRQGITSHLSSTGKSHLVCHSCSSQYAAVTISLKANITPPEKAYDPTATNVHGYIVLAFAGGCFLCTKLSTTTAERGIGVVMIN